LIPFTKAFVPEVNIAKGQIFVRLPDASDDDAPTDT
jgi:ribosomal 30S subunit maturation factor RimM